MYYRRLDLLGLLLWSSASCGASSIPLAASPLHRSISPSLLPRSKLFTINRYGISRYLPFLVIVLLCCPISPLSFCHLRRLSFQTIETNSFSSLSFSHLQSPHRLIWPRWSATLYLTLCGIILMRARGLLHHSDQPTLHINPSPAPRPTLPRVLASLPAPDLLNPSPPLNPRLRPHPDSHHHHRRRPPVPKKAPDRMLPQGRLPTQVRHRAGGSNSQANRTSLRLQHRMIKNGAAIQS